MMPIRTQYASHYLRCCTFSHQWRLQLISSRCSRLTDSTVRFTTSPVTGNADIAQAPSRDVESAFAAFEHGGDEQLPEKVVPKQPKTKLLRRFVQHEFRPPPFSVTARSKPQQLQIHDGVLSVVTETRGLVPVPGRLLRDLCSCALCRNAETGQKRVNVIQMVSKQCEVVNVEMSGSGSNVIEVWFGDGHKGVCSADIAARNTREMLHCRLGHIPISTWTSEISGKAPRVDYAHIKAGNGMAELLSNIRTHGFAFIDGMPITPEASERLLESIGPIRNTHYGGFYDFTSDLSSKDTAYTAEALEPHTDNTYFTEPAGLQALHMLSHTDGEGGESSLVDGFGAAAQLFSVDQEAYQRLSLTGVYAHASGNEGISIQPANAFPTLGHNLQTGYLNQVRWNTADRAGTSSQLWNVEQWYEAAAKFDALINDPKNQYWFQLQPGTMLIFDNWRVLHGRASFTGKRRMCGGYINRDDFISRYRMTNLSQDDIRASTVSG